MGWISQLTSPRASCCTVRPVQVPLQIVPSTSEQLTPLLGSGITHPAGSREITIPANTSTPKRIIQIVRFMKAGVAPERVVSLSLQHDRCVHHAGSTRLVDRGAIHRNAVLLRQA